MKINKRFLLTVSLLVLALFGSFLKLSPIFGAYKISFSGINFLIPLLGYFLKPLFLPLTFVFFLLKKITFGGALTLGIPTFMATLAIAVINKKNVDNNYKYKVYDFLLRVVLPLSAIILFVLNPIGREAFLYSFYWFIPVIIFLVEIISKRKSIFTNSLSATFIAHAVGSLIWLYTIGMSSLYWNLLIPRVAIERLVFAAGMTVCYLGLKKILNILSAKGYKQAIPVSSFIKN